MNRPVYGQYRLKISQEQNINKLSILTRVKRVREHDYSNRKTPFFFLSLPRAVAYLKRTEKLFLGHGEKDRETRSRPPPVAYRGSHKTGVYFG